MRNFAFYYWRDTVVVYRLVLLLLFCASYGGNAGAQENEDVLLSIHYMAHFYRYEEDEHEFTEEKVLDVTGSRSAFYGRWQRKREEMTDSIIKAHGTMEDVLSKTGEYPRPRQFYSIFNNYPNPQERVVTDKVFKGFYYTEPVDEIAWEFVDGDTVVAEYACHFAKCRYRGHEWTACFTDEIAIPLGPWKLHGLPGMILYAADDSGKFAFECIEIRKGNGELYRPNLSKYRKCSKAELMDLYRESAKNPMEYLKRFGMGGAGVDQKGRPLVYKEKTALFMEE